ncbi:MAG: hypothetical protein GY739_01240 [Mesoflavibacter sp.]|nr:hypothetical protein [Mesoflavibacter sp.]
MDCENSDNIQQTVKELQALVSSLSSEVQTLSRSLEETKNLVTTLQKNSEMSDISAEVQKVKQLLDIDNKPKPKTNLNSHTLSPDLAKIGRSVHIGNVGTIINVNCNTWKFKDSHFNQIAALFGHTATIVRIQQLRQKQFKGKISYPVNVFFASEGHRKNALASLKLYCEYMGVNMPSCQFALASYPDLQHKVKLVTQTLNEAKLHGLVQAYAITNFTIIKGETIIPLYQFKSGGSWSKTKDSVCETIFSSDKAPGQFDTIETAAGLSLKEAILNHIDKTLPDYTEKPPPPKPFLNDFIQKPRSPSKRSMEQDSHDSISNKIMRKNLDQDSDTGNFPSDAPASLPKPSDQPQAQENLTPSPLPTVSAPVVPMPTGKPPIPLAAPNLYPPQTHNVTVEKDKDGNFHMMV